MSPTQDQQQSQVSGSAFSYQPQLNSHDEACSAEGVVHPRWAELLQRLHEMGTDSLSERQIKSQRILRDDGANYKTWKKSREEHHWSLDPIPLLIESQQWDQIESGLLQRSELFDKLLRDIYGEQNIIRHGVVPPEAVFANPAFLRPCFAMPFHDSNALILHGVDMIQTRDGVEVIGDRTQAPSGAGYALENRTVMTRVFPSLFRESYVHRLALFFQTLRLKLNELAPNGELPNIVVLTPGSYSEAYFEHAFLANYLGYTLVQGRDMVVRNGYVWFKSLNGLTRVDVILRRVDDYFCDPAELRSDSYLGIPGLLEVIRNGKVALANPLGSGVLESPVFLKYLPQINQELGSEPLQLNTAKTWWAYDKLDLEYINDNFQDLIIKPVYRRFGEHSVLVRSLDGNEANALRQRIMAKPQKYVAQQYIEPGYAPAWQGQEISPRPTILRSFVVAGQDKYRVMPGGLTRQGASPNDTILTSQLSHWSKDTWVLASEPQKQITLWADQTSHVDLEQEQHVDVPSRVVENMFWLGRYAVRAEYALRLLRSVFVQLNNIDPLSKASYQTILKAVTQVTESWPGFTAKDSLLFDNPEAELISIIIDADRQGSVVSTLSDMLNSAEEVKVLLSADTQRIVNDIRDNLDTLEQSVRRDFASAPEEALDPLVTSLLALSGLVRESMIRGYGWRFIEIGRDIERAYQTMSLIDALIVPVLDEPDEDSILETLLLTLETLITYRRRYRGHRDLANGLELTILDDSNPRSLNFIAQSLQRHINALPTSAGNRFLSQQIRIPLALLNTIQLSHPANLCRVEKGMNERQALKKMLLEAKGLVSELSNTLSDRFFDHIEKHHRVEQASWEDEL